MNPQLFLSGFKNFTSIRIRVQIKFARPHVYDTYPDSLLYPGLFWEYWHQSMRRKAREICILLCLERTWERGCHREYIHSRKELGSILLRHRVKKNRYLKIRRRRRQRQRELHKSHRVNKQTTTLHVQHTFLYISLPFLHEYDVKMPNFMFYKGRKQSTTKFSISFLTWIRLLRIQLQESTFDKVSMME